MAEHLRDATKKMDFISREAALYVHCSESDRGGCVDLPENGGYCRLGNRYCEEGKLFDNIPAADVRQVVLGKWIVDSIASNIFSCSVCGNDAPVEPTGGTEYKSNFCPNCGADMREVFEIDQVKEGEK